MPHTEETGVVQAVATQQTALCRRETEFLTSDTLDLPHFAQRAPRTMIPAMLIRSNGIGGITPSIPGGDRPPVDIPFYDATTSEPISPMITHLCETFFTRLGCNYPFLQRERFLRDLEEKRVDAILVDAVCAVVAHRSLRCQAAMIFLLTPRMRSREHLGANQNYRKCYGSKGPRNVLGGDTIYFDSPRSEVKRDYGSTSVRVGGHWQ